ncbi:MAG: hydrogenase expression/formation protein HypE [Candidatus Methanofastidiosum sp.]|nr:hydrogenase expression/formation protein HypE [Methanofastidiosum sp.]NYT12939.1 hydrogenase expression/formation protein HypE [Candidatus Methanofastidiosa archaeon]
MDEFNSDIIKSEHGGGGEMMEAMIKSLYVKGFSLNKVTGGLGLSDMDDSGTIPFCEGHIVFTTDSHTVTPLFFPGGDIGRLSVSGTINDISVMGAKPLALSSGVILPEGFPTDQFRKVIKSMNETLKEADVPLITGDTKVAGNDLFINTSGVGYTKNLLSDKGLKEGDLIIVSGTVGDHGASMLSVREDISFLSNIKSDVAPLNKMIEKILPYNIHAMKDPTRGGIANALNEFSKKSGLRIEIKEENVPVREEVSSICDILGLNYMEIACEGKVLVAASREDAETVLDILRKDKLGKNAAIIGEVKKGEKVLLETIIGGKRILESPIADPVPRVC